MAKPRKPPALRPGDVVGVVAPSAALERGYLEAGVGALAALGYRVKVSAHALDRAGIMAGTDAVRAAELNAFFADPEVRAIFAARGGYGAGRILPQIDYAAIARRPKIFVGFSDATFVLNALVDRAGVIAFHGPMVAMDFARGLTPRSSAHLQRLLGGAPDGFELEAEAALRPGTAAGELIGGCLSVVVATLGTPYAPRFDGRILFLEDTGEKAYRIDRMLVQLRQSGALGRVAGIVFGAIRPLGGDELERIRIAEFAAEQTRDLGCPVLFGIEAGHGSENLTLPFGATVRLEAGARRLVCEDAVVS
ncbi:LD-carboxypeptidase [bacterium]|nr:LD-carboxypeptidase [bacterium]